MDKQKIKDFIAQHAEIKELKPVTNPGIRLDETHQNDVKVGDEWILINKDTNPTLGFKFVKLKENFKACELGCGDVVANQIVESKVCTTPVPHWRTKCTNCDCFVSPDGKGFIKGGHAIQAAYTKYFSEQGIKRDRHSKPKKTQTVSSANDPVEIVSYERSKPSKYITDSSGNITLNPEADK